MRKGQSELMRVDGSFFNILSKKVIRDTHERKYFKKYNPDKKVYANFKEATRSLADELRKKNDW